MHKIRGFFYSKKRIISLIVRMHANRGSTLHSIAFLAREARYRNHFFSVYSSLKIAILL